MLFNKKDKVAGVKCMTKEGVYNLLLKTIDEYDIKYERDDENLTVATGVMGDDLPITLLARVLDGPKALLFTTALMFDVPVEKRQKIINEINNLNAKLYYGRFYMDPESGRVFYDVSHSYFGTELSQGSIKYMFEIAVKSADDHDGELKALVGKELRSASMMYQ